MRFPSEFPGRGLLQIKYFITVNDENLVLNKVETERNDKEKLVYRT